MKIEDLTQNRSKENFALHDKYLNSQMVKILQTIDFDRHYVRAKGAYLFDEQDNRYLDLLSGFGVFALGRNHAEIVEALKSTLDADMPNLVQLDVSLLSGLLAEKLVKLTPEGLDRVFFANSGTETVEAAIKFSRYATGKSKIIFCHGCYHGLSLGSLSATGDDHYKKGFGPLVPDFIEIPFNNLEALEQVLAQGDVAAFITEPIQGHGVWIPDDNYLPEAARLARKYGALFIADEIQTGLGRTGKWWAVEHWSVEPDILCTSKALSGGFVPVGALVCKEWIFDRVFNRMDRAVVHGSTFGKNNLAMAAGLATLEVLESENLIEHSARTGAAIMDALTPLTEKYECFKEIRGKGMMIALEFTEPKSPMLKMSWKMLESANKGLFSQLITVPLFREHRILSQVAGHGMNIVKFIPPLILTESDVQWIVSAVNDVLANAHRGPAAVWDFGKTLALRSLRNKLRS
ncbi:MAG: aspartate aminotransferase family protein [Nitrosomonas sp.]|uniref:aspartate aminotransferase family protein n=1 Tax=Nitrosomonas sp. TaxID=42353 RepID=UPI00256118C9|nr:aspartate aminotransferase family protein [Nitrosomonas sp.]MCC6160905.1 aspartate aminotransferase family protein [Nitrosomonas sp.]MDL1866490.1 aspartate aminotransferase family protein [Betaproteobacteria bacterium PRO4]